MCAAAYPLWLGWLGAFLVRQDGPEKAEMIVVLAGDQFGNRIEKACDLLREGYAPSVLVSGPCCYYGIVESDAAVEFAAKKGCPADRLISFPVKARNTVDEAAELMAELRRRGVRRFLVVTSDYHTRRAGNAFRRVTDGASFRVVGAPDEYFTADGWWREREAQKVVFFEWSKTVATWFGL
ncbi:MAG: YdcF family protein [bacterium]